MSNPKKILIAALAVIFLAGATPLLAQLNGTWAGEGEGVCSPPPPIPTDFPIYAWQNWKGLVEDNEVFYGEWYDNRCNNGTFKGEIVFVTPEDAYCEGEWHWFDERYDPPRVYYMGPFSMKFKLEEAICYGEWRTYYSNESGTMKGEKID
ncbi:hypothetical protein CEE36_02915 [candidate division TA06 bacterium B3_TA06]|uniref:Uncharacterized protein n=1 Tax=candidate division TA06 bacterium B3_TA06 TaxID=2012487 RepID=A0A532V8Y3_UNCT6|nr:MAG: hypothetical protein CEE36_02915 [candidate division TA06 bacterium B3_TA06]